MKKNTFLILTLLVGTILVSSCTNDSSADLSGIDELDEVTYTNTVKSIIDNNCISCHATTPINGAPMSLTTYENVKDAVLTRGLLDRISRAQGEPGMMPSGGTRLPQAVIDQVIAWDSQGLTE
ncbi:c-type cytochrome [Flavobacterium sp.]|uniref:c-type cytochrome n=1 Tax=Flavobacterium sp. TaxID=239 RepID=UPI00391910D6